MAKETGKESNFAVGIKLEEGDNLSAEEETRNGEKKVIMEYSWDVLTAKSGLELYNYYKDLLRLFGRYCTGRVREIYQGAMTNIEEPKNLEKIITTIDDLDWFSAREEGLGNVFIGKIDGRQTCVTLGLAAIFAAVLLPGMHGVAAMVVTMVAIFILGQLLKRTLGGQTGDTLGAAIELGELVFLLALL